MYIVYVYKGGDPKYLFERNGTFSILKGKKKILSLYLKRGDDTKQFTKTFSQIRVENRISSLSLP